MAKERGLLLTCDRCKETVFLKELHAEEKERDGGYTRWNEYEYEYEETPEGWSYQYIGDLKTNGYNLCPSCTKKLAQLSSEFFEKEKDVNDQN